VKATFAAAGVVPLLLMATTAAIAETSLRTDSFGSDWIGGHLRVTDADGTFRAIPNYLGGVSIEFCRASSECWLLEFSAPHNHPLSVGYYPDARRYIVNEPGSAGLSISGDGRGCNHSTGWFQVKELQRGSDGGIDVFRAVFEQSCDESGGGLVGEVRWNVDVPVAVHPTAATTGHRRETIMTFVDATVRVGGPVRLSASSLPRGATFEDLGDGHGRLTWSPRLDQIGRWPVSVRAEAAGGSSDSTIIPLRVVGATVLDVASEVGDPVGLGLRQTKTEDDGVFWTDRNLRDSRVVSFGTSRTSYPLWVLWFAAPFGEALAPGTFANATNLPYGPLDRPGLSAVADGRWCRNDIEGGFEIHEIGYGTWGNLERLNASFDQRCTEASGGLHGQILLNADVIENAPPIARAGAERPVVECTSTDGAVVSLDASASSDPDGDALDYAWAADGIAFGDATSPTPTAAFPLGTTTVSLTVTDGLESSTDEVSVTVVDTSPPEVTLSAQPSTLWPPNGRMVDVHLVVRVIDRCDPMASFVLVSISSNGVSARSRDADLHDADFGSSDTEFLLRATRNGGNLERRYVIAYEGRDRFANASIVTTEISVPHDLAK
jgi:PKD domain-containing protein